jgi:Domain of unknown function (DUF4062)
MSFQANVLRVMIASPGDVAEERVAVTEEIHRWNDANAFARKLVLLPIKWETHSTPQQGDHPQAIINRQLLEDADIVVAIFGTRIGTRTEEYVSGTVEEIKKHVAAGKIAKIYFSDVPVPPSSLNPEQYALVQEFRTECQSTGLFATFNNAQQFRTDFKQHLDLELNQARYLWLSPPEPAAQPVTSDINPDGIRLITAAASTDGMVISQETLGGSGLHAGGKEFMDGNPRSAARWRAILGDLADRGVLERTPGAGMYRLSAAGFEIADKAQALEEASKPTEITLNIAGSPNAQYLEVKSNRNLRLSQLEFLTSTEACISTQSLSEEGKEIKAQLAHDKVVALFNSPRPDRNHSDHSGPAKLRLIFYLNDRLREAVLPVVLQPRFVQNSQWISLTGSKTFQLPA